MGRSAPDRLSSRYLRRLELGRWDLFTLSQRHTVRVYRFRESFHLLLTQILVVERKTPRRRLGNSLGDTNTTWIGELFQALRKHDVWTCQGVICNDHFSKTDADPEYRTKFVPKRTIVLGIVGLESQGCRDCIRRPVELGK